MKSPPIALVSLALGLVLVAGSQYAAAPSDPGLVSRQQVKVLRERIRKNATARQIAAAAVRPMLLNDGLGEAQLDGHVVAIKSRVVRELERYAGSLRGTKTGSIDAAYAKIVARERILLHSVAEWPRGFAEARPLVFVVDEKDADKLELGVGAMVRAHEAGIREAAIGLREAGQLSPPELRGLRDFARKRAEARGRAVLDEMRGAAFFSEAGAALYLENAVAAEMDAMLARMTDPVAQQAFLEQVRTGS